MRRAGTRLGIAFGWLVILASAWTAFGAQAGAPADRGTAARLWVQRFYTWYVPIARKGRSGPAFVVALNERRAEFSDQLFGALKADADAQAKVPGDIVGLDYDPFLGSQDPCERYDADTVTPDGDRFRVALVRVCGGKRQKPGIIAEVAQTRASWQFVNFHDPDSKDDLLGVLAILAADRRKPVQHVAALHPTTSGAMMSRPGWPETLMAVTVKKGHGTPARR